jgi:hypothetical protein
MPIDATLLTRARQHPESLTFDEAVALAKQLGWIERKVRGGSHKIFHHPLAQKIKDRFPRPLNLQRGKSGTAKQYQVEQMLDMAIGMGIITKE